MLASVTPMTFGMYVGPIVKPQTSAARGSQGADDPGAPTAVAYSSSFPGGHNTI